MTSRFLPTALRKTLERAILAARTVAETGAEDAIRRLGVADAKAPGHLSEAEQATRRRLRAHARTLGDEAAADGTHAVTHLIEAAAYAQWHRRLFARFLAERQLLRHPEHKAPVTLEDVEELAAEEGFADGWSAAESYGARMLPAVFQPDDPVLALILAPEHAQALRRLVLGLDPETFQADDSLGWTYQFWRTAEKKRVNDSQVKIGAAELPAVTQLFTEPYMVRFLLHNTLGAWRAGKILAARPDLAAEAPDEDALRAAVALPGYDFDMLRFVKEGEDAPRWRPAAGTYPGWPTEAAKITVLDPCCGSGHFLTEALTILAGVRAEEEGSSRGAAVTAVLKDNLFGLEIDGRCVQIAAFAVALSAWKIGGFRTLPVPHIAWVGAPPPLPKLEFAGLANGDEDLRVGLDKLWDLFDHAPILGSLIEPTAGDLMSPQRLGRIGPLLEPLVRRARISEPERAEGAIAARGMADAAGVLAGRYTLVVTNPPFLGQGNFSDVLFELLRVTFPESKADLCVTFLDRATSILDKYGTSAFVTKQEWCFLPTFQRFRKTFLQGNSLDMICFLGEEAWEAFGQRGPKATLSISSNSKPTADTRHSTIDLTSTGDREQKIASLRIEPPHLVFQADQIRNPGTRISSGGFVGGTPLSLHARVMNGLVTGDGARFQRVFWECSSNSNAKWRHQQSAAELGKPTSGKSGLVRWDTDFHQYIEERLGGNPGAWIRGQDAWNRIGVVVSGMRYLSVTTHDGHAFDNNCSVIVANNPEHDAAIFAFCSDPEFNKSVRRLNPKTSVTDDTFVQVPFDLPKWQKVAADRYPSGLPEPFSDDPTQWLFHGHPAEAEAGASLHVALARLAGYRWPPETDPQMRLSDVARDWIAKAQTLPAADSDGILALSAAGADRPLADRLRAHFAAAFGDPWDDALERRLVAEADLKLDKKAAKDGSLEAWLKQRAFRQHCKLFHDRPFLWHVWDQHADGFSAFLDYHRLNNGTLQKLTYSVLGDWIRRRKDEGDEPRQEAAQILQNKLAAILEGEDPFDIFVRWKSLAEQPLGWNPDLDDGVRLNIRPWVEAGVLRDPPKIKWGVDRGKDLASAPWFPLDQGKRDNGRHTTLAEKRAARAAARTTVDA